MILRGEITENFKLLLDSAMYRASAAGMVSSLLVLPLYVQSEAITEVVQSAIVLEVWRIKAVVDRLDILFSIVFPFTADQDQHALNKI